MTLNYSDTLMKLKFISMLKVSEKIDTTNFTAERDTFLNAIFRWYNGESRQQTLAFLTETVDRSFEITQITLHSNRDMCKTVIRDLSNSIKGLEAIRQTYLESNDRIFSCHIQNLIQMIESKLQTIRDTNPELMPPSPPQEEPSNL